jgi:hypothetical protein
MKNCALLQAELLRDFEKEKQDTLAITADMTRQYKAMQEELLKRLNVLENTIQEQKDQLGEDFDLPETKLVLFLVYIHLVLFLRFSIAHGNDYCML